MNSITFTLNGEQVTVEERPGEVLADLLRGRLGLTGTKVACREGECGACTVLLDGEPVNSCLVLSSQADGHEVLTIEGLSTPCSRRFWTRARCSAASARRAWCSRPRRS